MKKAGSGIMAALIIGFVGSYLANIVYDKVKEIKEQAKKQLEG